MRFIGGKDYYDGVTGFDTDDRIVFIRQNFAKAEHRPKDKVYGYESTLVFDNYSRKSRWKHEGADLGTIDVIFCGLLYRGLVRTETKYNADAGQHSTTYHCFWDHTSALAELERQDCKLHDDDFAWRPHGVTTERKRVTPDTFHKYFEPQPLPQRITDMLIADNVVHSIQLGMVPDYHPKYTTNYPKWVDNTDGLKAIGFASVIDPWQAYQQIDMWLGSQLARDEDNMVKLSDKELIAKHGFDKVSFRNTHHAGKPRGR